MTIDQQITDDLAAIRAQVWDAIESRLNSIGSVIRDEAKNLMLEERTTNGQAHKYIYDKGDFYRNSGYVVQMGKEPLLRVGSNVKHEPWVMGGKVPSWTPFDPLKAWVERKGLDWTTEDKKTGKIRHLDIDEIVSLIQIHHLREGIPARDVFADVMRKREVWINEQLNSIFGELA